MFLIEKYKVTTIDDVIFNKDVYDNFDKVINIQNLLICGPVSSGKKTLIKLLLTKLYNENVHNIKDTEYTITNYGSNNVKVNLQQSNYHLIFKPFNSALDKYIIQEIIVEFCKKNNLCFFDIQTPFKVILIHNADLLSNQAQYALCTLMEHYSDVCRFILFVKNINTITNSIIVRANTITLKAPSHPEMEILFDKIIKNEKINISNETKKQIIMDSNRHVKNMLWRIESHLHGIPYKCYWKNLIDEIINSIINDKEKVLKNTNKFREYIGYLFISNMDANVLLEYILIKIVNSINDINLLSEITYEIAKYDKSLKNSTRYILHFESLFHQIIFLINNFNSSIKMNIK